MDLMNIPLPEYKKLSQRLVELLVADGALNVRQIAAELRLTQKNVVMLAEDAGMNIDVAIRVGNGMASLRMGDWLVYPLD